MLDEADGEKQQIRRNMDCTGEQRGRKEERTNGLMNSFFNGWQGKVDNFEQKCSSF